jgi:peptide-methionine (R)-S-oxide reductase
MKIDRRAFLAFGGAAMVAGVAFTLPGRDGGAAAQGDNVPFRLTDAQWRQRLSPAQYATLRHAFTERAGTSPLNNEHRRGIFHCAGCNQALYSSAAKFESGTGWPSFFRPLPHAIVTRADHSLLDARTEVLCARCGGHIGHVFDDGPPPTGLRYCMNGVAMTFQAA